MTTTPTNPKAVRLALNAANVDTAQLDIVPSSHGVLISTLTQTASDATLIIRVQLALTNTPGLDDLTRRGPYVIKVNSRRRR